jgi:hypothetical protein
MMTPAIDKIIQLIMIDFDSENILVPLVGEVSAV